MERPRFKAHLHCEVVDDERIALVSEHDMVVMTGRIFPLLAPHLNGRDPIETIAARLAPDVTYVDVVFGVSCLDEAGWLADGPLPPMFTAAALDEAMPGAPRASASAPRVEMFGRVPRALVAELLQSADFAVADRVPTIVVVDDYLRHELIEFNDASLRIGQPWLLVKPVGTEIWIGPLFDPPRSACWSCVAGRLRAHRRRRHAIDREAPFDLAPGTVPQLASPWTVQTAIGLLCSRLRQPPSSGRGLLDTIVTLDLRSSESREHHVTPWPDCSCRPDRLAVRTPPELTLQSRKKIFGGDGGHRASTPDDTYRELAGHVSPITGIVSRLASTVDHPLIHTWAAEFSEPPGVCRSLFVSRPHRSSGKGMTPAQARTSALCEALERYAGVFRGDEARLRSSFAGLEDAAIDPRACLLVSDAQYRARADWNGRQSRVHWIPQPFDPGRAVDWSPVRSLSSGEVKQIATASCFYGYPADPEHEFCRADSNGCAAGSSFEDAVLQGFLEIVERDCLAQWWYQRARRPQVDLSTFEQPYFVALEREYGRLGRTLEVLDITNDLRIPTVVAVSRRREGSADTLLGAGCHLDPSLAVARALTEMNQFLPGVLAGRAPQLFSIDPAGEPYVTADPLRAPVVRRDFPFHWHDDLRDDLHACITLARARGLDVFVLDQTRADVALPVVKVVVPGMRPFRARFAPGRLFDVPEALRWVAAASPEHALNPSHMLA